MKKDVIILGAGGAGMMCAIQAAKRGREVLLLDHSAKIGGKILISGGGRCNFTNTGASPAQYVSQNRHFCKSALMRFPSESIVQMVREHGIAFHEKKLGQLFCDGSAQAIVTMLKKECDEAGAKFQLETKIEKISQTNSGFEILTSQGTFASDSLVIATGGLSIPKIGATGIGYQIAKQFGIKVTPTAPALDGFTFAEPELKNFAQMAGVSLDCIMTCNGISFQEALLFTHAGLSGPVSLQASLHWKPGDDVFLDFLPKIDVFGWFLQKKKAGNRTLVRNLLSELLPSRLADRVCEIAFPSNLPLPQVSEKALETFCERLHSWKIVPSGTVGYSKAEVTRGGVDTDELSSKTLESKKVKNLFFIGEVVDVTGWLGGYNFQWAWASGWAAGQVV